MKKLISGLALMLTSVGLAACGSSNDPATNATLGNEASFDEEIPADENLTITDNALPGDGFAENAVVGNGS